MTEHRDTGSLRPWAECEVFCARGHSGIPRAACGWRGLHTEAAWDRERLVRICPRCAGPVLLPVPSSNRSSQP